MNYKRKTFAGQTSEAELKTLIDDSGHYAVIHNIEHARSRHKVQLRPAPGLIDYPVKRIKNARRQVNAQPSVHARARALSVSCWSFDALRLGNPSGGLAREKPGSHKYVREYKSAGSVNSTPRAMPMPRGDVSPIHLLQYNEVFGNSRRACRAYYALMRSSMKNKYGIANARKLQFLVEFNHSFYWFFFAILLRILFPARSFFLCWDYIYFFKYLQ